MIEIDVKELSTTFPGGVSVGPLSIAIETGEFISLLGPSGCGKTTLLRMLAGFARPSTGTVRLRGRDVTRMPPHRRGIGLVFQDYALFPHLSVAANIAFGPRRHGLGRKESARRVERMLSLLRLDGLGGRRPSELSGGQRQRVALARVLAIEPSVVLLDEPFSGLDAELREATRRELHALQREVGFTALMVTHDQSEALSISDRIAVMRQGRFEQVGTALEVYRRPASTWVAGFIGRINRVPGGIVRPEDIRIVVEGTPGARPAVVETATFFGSSGELTVYTRCGLTLLLVVPGSVAVQHPTGSALEVMWDTADEIRSTEAGSTAP